MSSFLNGISDFVSTVGSGVKNFVDFIITIPSLIYNLLDIIPEPLFSIINAFIGFVIFVVLMKVVRLLVG